MDYIISATAYFMKLGGSLKSVIDQFMFPMCRRTKLTLAKIKGTGVSRTETKRMKQLKLNRKAIEKLYLMGFLQPY